MQNHIGIFVESAKEHSIDDREIYNMMKLLFISFFLSVLITDLNYVYAKENYLNELIPGVRITFKHLDLNRSEISGYSFFSFETFNKNGRKFIIEKNENTKPNGKVFTRKSLWFDSNSGEPVHYIEEDLRNDFKIKSTYTGEILKTSIDKAGKVLDFQTDLSVEKAVPFELVFYFIRKNFQHILQQDGFSFTLFIPMLAIELEEKGLPRNMGMIRMVVELKEEIILETPLGKFPARKILILPQSGFLRVLLPSEKTHFKFIIAKEAPHHILQFETGKIRNILTELILPD